MHNILGGPYSRGEQIFKKIWEPSEISGHQNEDMKQVPYTAPNVYRHTHTHTHKLRRCAIVWVPAVNTVTTAGWYKQTAV